ncbi:unnamed protein product [Ectocarpus sp. 4 AP-2014]
MDDFFPEPSPHRVGVHSSSTAAMDSGCSSAKQAGRKEMMPRPLREQRAPRVPRGACGSSKFQGSCFASAPSSTRTPRTLELGLPSQSRGGSVTMQEASFDSMPD